ncbi:MULTISPECIES: DUF4430 domain-containing protein [Pseudomonas]|uniref:DUF4430 domain-containing protein n=1 Tax=Pseudomonas TaxID=286 RepID=UPI00138F7DBF|nr:MULTISPECIES: DUF4430 domain-containing protein [Pseudomonas]WHS55510.1 DUF4430 domain-containing protein [Pseudomonas brassicacearum]
MNTTQSVTVSVVGGPSATVPWSSGMNAQQALEGAYNIINNTSVFTYALQYYGDNLGYLVMMINETYDSFISSSAPFLYWEFLVNGSPAATGIDSIMLEPGDAVSFELEIYDAAKHTHSTIAGKRQFQASITKLQNQD